ncbi:Phosphatidylinositol-4-phosphate 5-kinase, partial [Cryptosporidium tyzzeri]
MHKIKIFFRKCSSFKLKQDIFTKIQNETNLSTKQIRDFYNTFISNSDN